MPLAAKERVYRFETGEDATSTHYDFVYSDGESVSRVRMLWNGGAQSKPTVTEYKLDAGEIKVIKMTGEREQIAQLIAGEEPKLTQISSYTLVIGHSPGMLTHSDGDKDLTESERVDIGNLISVLARERIEAQQDGTGQPATRPESKSEGGDKPQPEAEGRSR